MRRWSARVEGNHKKNRQRGGMLRDTARQRQTCRWWGIMNASIWRERVAIVASTGAMPRYRTEQERGAGHIICARRYGAAYAMRHNVQQVRNGHAALAEKNAEETGARVITGQYDGVCNAEAMLPPRARLMVGARVI